MVPSFSKSESTIITHREFITDVYSGAGSPSAFTLTSYPINPGLSSSFPWLAFIAANYEEYDILGMVYEFKSNSGESVAGTNTTLGTVIMATQYDPTRPDFEGKQQMENYFFSQSCKPSQSMLHAIECKKNQTVLNHLYVRSSAYTADQRFTDFGKFYIATVGMQAAGINLGELWVTYKVKLLKPRLPSTLSLGGNIGSATMYSTTATAASPAGTVQTTTTSPIVANMFGSTISWTAQPNSYYCVVVAINAATSAPVIGFNTLVNIAAANRYVNRTTDNFVSLAGGAGTNTIAVRCFQTTQLSGQATASFNISCAMVGAGNITVIITQVDDTFGLV